MFDLAIKDASGAGVPVPLLGRVIVFAGPDGLLVRNDDGSIAEYGKGDAGATGATGPQGPAGEAGATGPQGQAGAQIILGVGPASADSASYVDVFYVDVDTEVDSVVSFDLSGVDIHASVAGIMNIYMSTDGTKNTSVGKSTGTAANSGRTWNASGRWLIVGGYIYNALQLQLSATNQSDGATGYGGAPVSGVVRLGVSINLSAAKAGVEMRVNAGLVRRELFP